MNIPKCDSCKRTVRGLVVLGETVLCADCIAALLAEKDHRIEVLEITCGVALTQLPDGDYTPIQETVIEALRVRNIIRTALAPQTLTPAKK